MYRYQGDNIYVSEELEVKYERQIKVNITLNISILIMRNFVACIYAVGKKLKLWEPEYKFSHMKPFLDLEECIGYRC